MGGGKIGHVFFSGWSADLRRDFFFYIHGSACLSRPRSSKNNVTPNNVNIPYYLMLSGHFMDIFGFVGGRRDFFGF